MRIQSGPFRYANAQELHEICDARIDSRCRERIGDKMETAAAELEQVLGENTIPRPRCRFPRDQVAPERVWDKVTIDKDDRDACVAQHGRQSTVEPHHLRRQLVGIDEDAAHPASRTVAETFLVLRVQVGVGLRLARTTPDQTVVVYSRQTGDFSSDDLKNFRYRFRDRSSAAQAHG